MLSIPKCRIFWLGISSQILCSDSVFSRKLRFGHNVHAFPTAHFVGSLAPSILEITEIWQAGSRFVGDFGPPKMPKFLAEDFLANPLLVIGFFLDFFGLETTSR